MKPKDIIASVNEYLNDTTAEYAVMLTGDWGTGKTHFVKNELANALANKTDKTSVIRTSLTGASSSDEIYRRIVQAAMDSSIPLPDDYENNAESKPLRPHSTPSLALPRRSLRTWD